jgi:hypothetical protein
MFQVEQFNLSLILTKFSSCTKEITMVYSLICIRFGLYSNRNPDCFYEPNANISPPYVPRGTLNYLFYKTRFFSI